MRTFIKRGSLLLVMLVPLILHSPAVHASYTPIQVIFSGTGVGNFPTVPGGSSAFGFWVGCVDSSSGPPGALSPYYTSPCVGTMSVNGLQLARQVIGTFVLSGGAYVISVHSLDGAIVASLTNRPPNTVTVAFSSPSGGGSITNAYVYMR